MSETNSPAANFGASSTAEQVTEGLDLSGQTWLITGANSGLGFETTRVLAKRGAKVIAAARTEAKAADALQRLGVEGTAVGCELSDLDSVQQAAAKLKAHCESHGPLNGIIANAGIMALPELDQVEGVERQFFTNHVGHFALITPLLDSLSEDARVVMLSSGAHFYAGKLGLELDNISGDNDYDAWRMYGRSKLANILFARGLTKRFEGSGRTANAVHPGVIQTNLARHIPEPQAEAMFEKLKPSIKSVPEGAATQCFVAVHPSLAGVSGQYFSDCAPAKTIDAARDDALAETLWQRTQALVDAHN